jgi:hypothetical protein
LSRKKTEDLENVGVRPDVLIVNPEPKASSFLKGYLKE